MKQLVASALLFLSLSIPCFATDDVKQAIEKMFILTDMQALLDNSYARMESIFSQMAEERKIPYKHKPIYEKYRDKLRVLLAQQMNWQDIKAPIINAYAQVYTKEEVEQLIRFYQSPLGQKTLTKMPELMQVSMQVMRVTSKKLLPKMQELQQDLAEELQKKSS